MHPIDDNHAKVVLLPSSAQGDVDLLHCQIVRDVQLERQSSGGLGWREGGMEGGREGGREGEMEGERHSNRKGEMK